MSMSDLAKCMGVALILSLAMSCQTKPKNQGSRSTARKPASVAPSFSQTPNLRPQTTRQYEPLDRPSRRMTKEDFSPDHNADGSLWIDRGQVNYFFAKNKTRQIGDILTVNVDQGLRTEILAALRANTVPTEWELRRQRREARRKALARRQGSRAGARSPAAAKSGSDAQAAADDRELKERRAAEEKDVHRENDIVNMEVLDRFDNGNYRVRGIKEVLFRGQRHRLEITGIARESDIGDDESVSSSKLLSAKVEYLQ